MSSDIDTPSGARPYHHGDLRAALIHAGLTLAREGGAAALRLRELTRLVGVTPNAAYRHFADHQALVRALAEQAQLRLAAAMSERIDTISPDADPAGRALHQLRGVGLGYIGFALSEPGWFELALLARAEPDPSRRGDEQAPAPYQLLVDALDTMVATGVLTPRRRVHAEWACWSAVHGFADLATRTALHTEDRDTVTTLAGHVVDTVINGLIA